MPVSVRDNSSSCMSELRSALASGLSRAGGRAVEHAREVVPVDTGALRDSIAYDSDGTTVTVFADTDYAEYVELGTSRQRAQPYLRPSVVERGDEYLRIIANAISSEL